MQTKNEYILGKTAALFGHEIVILYSSSELYFSGNSDTLCGNSLRIVYFFWMYGGQGRGRKGGRGKEGGEGGEREKKPKNLQMLSVCVVDGEEADDMTIFEKIISKSKLCTTPAY